MRRLTMVAALLLAGACGGPSYPRTEVPSFRCEAPRALAFDALVRQAAQLGYVHVSVDPFQTTFAVHAHTFGSPRGPRPIPRHARGPVRIRDDIFIVEITDDAVRVRPFGPHVVDDVHVHPELAQELRVFARAMRQTTAALSSGGVAAIVGSPLPGTSTPNAVPTPRHPITRPQHTPSGAGGALAEP